VRLAAAIATLTDLNAYSVVFRIVLSALFGGCAGTERRRHGRAAGMRTYILVCLGSAMTTMIGLYTNLHFGFSNDPLRMGAQVISGIGFLGAGTIMIRNRSRITGLTTAAGLWTTACIGLAIGVGFYWAAVVGFLMMMLTLSLMGRLEGTIKRRDSGAYYIELADIHKVKRFYEEMAPWIAEVEVVPAKSGVPTHVGLEVTLGDIRRSEELAFRLQTSSDIVIAVPLHQ